MITFPNARINLELNVTEKRPDGYHNPETVFYSVLLKDTLEITILNDSKQKFALHQSGLEINGEPESNLVVKAYLLLNRGFQLSPIDIYLYKHTPSGAGLGGDSADAALMLRLLNERFHLHPIDKKLEECAAMLGINYTFFVKDKPTFAEGIGNVSSPVGLSLKGYQLILVKPGISVSAREAFPFIRPRRPEYSLEEVIKRPANEWRDNMLNDFEESIFLQYPVIEDIKRELYRKGAVYAAMPGSDSSIFGLFNPEEEIVDLDFGRAFCFQTKLKQPHHRS